MLGFGDNVARLDATLSLESGDFTKGLAAASAELTAFNAKLKDEGVNSRLAGMASRDMAKELYNNARAADQTTQSHSRLASALKFGMGNWKLLAGGAISAGVAILGFTGNISALAPLIPVLTLALTGLLVPFTTLAALVVALAGPLTVLFGILTGVGIGAILGFKSALGSAGKQFAPFRKAIDSLKDSFGQLTHSLAVAFMPWFMKMIPVAKDVLGYFGQLAKIAGKSGLSGVFKSLSDGGFARLNKDFLKIIGPIGDLIAKTIAFAFGTGGGEGQSILKADFKRFVAWLSTAFQPIIAWFNRQDFTKTGYRWGSELAGAIVKTIGAAIGKALSSPSAMMIGGGATAGAVIGGVIGGPIGIALGAAIGAAAGIILNHYWPKIVSTAKSFWNALPKYIEKILGPSLWNQVKSLMRSFGDTVKAVAGFFLHDVWPVVKKIWDKLGGWHTVIVAIVLAIRIVVAAFVVVATVVRAVYNFLKTVWDVVSQIARAIAGAVVSAWHIVLGVLHTIGSVLSEAWSKVKSLAGAVSGGLASAWNGIKGIVSGIGSTISGWIHDIENISWPSPPSWVGKVAGIFGASGGIVQGGTPGQDSVHAMLMPGEVVLSRGAVDRLGGPQAANSYNLGSPTLRMAAGGIVPPTIPTTVLNAPAFKNPAFYKSDAYWGSRLRLAEKELKRAHAMPKGTARDRAIKVAENKIHNLKAKMAHNSPKLAAWVANRVDAFDATMQFREQTWDTQFQNTGDSTWFNKEQAQRLQEVSLFEKAAAFARARHLGSEATQYARSAISTYQDYQTAAKQTATTSASEVAAFLSDFNAFQAAAGSNVSFFGATNSPGTTTAGASGATGATVHVHQSFISTDDQFTHMRRAKSAAMSVFG